MTHNIQSLRQQPPSPWERLTLLSCFFSMFRLFCLSVCLLYLSLGSPYPHWFSLESITMGAKDWAGLVNKALMPNAIEERGDLEQKKQRGSVPQELHVCIYVCTHVYVYVHMQQGPLCLWSPPWAHQDGNRNSMIESRRTYWSSIRYVFLRSSVIGVLELEEPKSLNKGPKIQTGDTAGPLNVH